MYEAKPIQSKRVGDEYVYTFTLEGEEYTIPTPLFRFHADSLEHAQQLLDPEEHE